MLLNLLLLWCAGLYLRLTLLLAPPLAPLIAAELGLGQAGSGALTTIPVLMLALAAVAGAYVIALLGARRTVALCLLVIMLGSLGRAAAFEAWSLYLATAVMGIGIAALQPALPALLPQWTPGRIALGTAVYMNGMLLGEVLGAGLTLPVVLPLVGGDWRAAIVAWSLPAALVAVAFLWRRPTTAGGGVQRSRVWMPDWRRPELWQLGMVSAAGSTLFFGTNAYMADVLAARGEADRLATGLLLFNSAQVVASLLMLRYAGRWVGRAAPLLWLLLAAVAGLALFMLVGGLTGLLFAVLVSFATGVLLILTVSLPPLLAPTGGTAALSAGMFTVGYAASFVVPLIGGLLADRTGSPTLALLPLLAIAVAALPVCRALGHRAEAALADRGTAIR